MNGARSDFCSVLARVEFAGVNIGHAEAGVVRGQLPCLAMNFLHRKPE